MLESISFLVDLICKSRKPKIVSWPVLSLTSWIKAAFEDPYKGVHFLGGKQVGTDSADRILEEFWDRYCKADLAIPMPQHPPKTVPIYIHGDEGRGLVKKPLMVISYQPVFSWRGPDSTNTSAKHGLYKWHIIFSGGKWIGGMFYI